MLGIASLATGGAEYYLEAVAAGREDYYLGSGKHPASGRAATLRP
ncbi:MAG: hypothetical protein M5T61_14185 [Acidimicrobiia bacterium]|nr:hypothetical protein [Acidimicrobiia bacterium]